MRKHKLFIAAFVALCFMMAQPVFAATSDKKLSNVAFHTEYIDTEEEHVLQKGVAELWAVIEPRTARQGFSEFPRAHIWGFSSVGDASRVSGLSSSHWQNFNGYASGSNAYILLEGHALRDEIVVAHEAMHVVQDALSEGDLGSRCLSEGAASWYSYKAVGRSMPDVIEELSNINSEDKIVGVSEEIKKQLIENGFEPNPLPAFDELTTGSQWKRVLEERGGQIYALCTLAFDLLIETGGGEDAYFEYMSELSRTDWRTAFNRAFNEDLETFQERFRIYRESWFEDYRLPSEIEHDKLINKLLDCKDSGLWTRKVCIR